MKRQFLILFTIVMGMCCSCSSHIREDIPLCRVVTHISITQEQGDRVVSHSYSDSVSMSKILSYLRKLKPYGNADAAAAEITDSRYQITLEYSDGTQHVYQQLGDHFFRGDGGNWKQIDEDLGKDLSGLFEELVPEETI